MSQAGIVDFIRTHPEVPILFVANVGSAIPIANTLEILGSAVTAHGVPLQTDGSGNTITINVQYASAAATSIDANAGVASFDSNVFTVDANGFVSLTAVAGATKMGVDAATAPGTNPVLPNGSGIITVTGGQVAAGTTTNVIQTNSLAANTYTIQIQRSSAQASSTIGANGVSHFNSTYFSVDANGFVSINGSAIGETITGNTGGALSPTAGNWNIFGSAVASGTTPVQTSGTASTLTVQVQRSQAIASTNATNVGLSAFNSTYFTVDANGFVSINGATIGQTITGDVGGALSPTAGNWNVLGTSTAAGTTPVQTSGTGSTLTVQVQKAQAIASTNATNVGLAAFDSTDFSVDANGFVTLNGSGAGQTITGNTGGALSPSGGNWNIVGSGSITTAGSVSTLTVQLTGLTNHAVLVGAGTDTITKVGPSSTTGALFKGNGSSADPGYSTTASIDDSIGLFTVTASFPVGGPQFLLQNTNSTVGSTVRNILATAGNGATSDAYTLYDAGGSAWEHGLSGTAKHYQFQTSPSNTHPYMDGTTVLDLSPTGEITMPLQPAFFVYVSSNINNVTGDGTAYTVIFDTEVFDQGSDFSLVTGMFTASVPGRYSFNVGSRLGGGTVMSAASQVLVTSNNSLGTSLYGGIGAGTATAQGFIGILCDLDAGDVASIQLTATDTGGKVDDVVGPVGGSIRNFFSGNLTC